MIERKSLEHINFPQFSRVLIVFRSKIQNGGPGKIRTYDYPVMSGGL